MSERASIPHSELDDEQVEHAHEEAQVEGDQSGETASSEAGQEALSEVKGDGESWEEYAHRLERRIKQQRDQLRDVQTMMDQPTRRAQTKIAALERALGRSSLKNSQQHEGLRALKDEKAGLVEQYQTALDRLWEAHDQLCGCDKPADEGRCSAPEETWGAFEYLGTRESEGDHDSGHSAQSGQTASVAPSDSPASSPASEPEDK